MAERYAAERHGPSEAVEEERSDPPQLDPPRPQGLGLPSEAVVDIETGDVLAEYDSLDPAKTRLSGFVEECPSRADELAIATLDDHGRPTGEVLSGLGHRV